MSSAALKPGNVAVITGGASGIGLAAARKFLSLGLKVCIADRDADRLTQAASRLGGTEDCVTAPCDVSLPEDLTNVERMVRERFGHIDVVMNNAGIQPGSQIFGAWENWDQVLAVNLQGVNREAMQITQRRVAGAEIIQ